ncbi:hypothetical protein [Deinococcus navajonensis]|uniref:Uncharacterized protein n=1 Tax=Deinococcus navajonensis TaxID=309884 RepID=A0ABV8XN58_9DEIO
MRKFNVVLTALVLGAFGVASAATLSPSTASNATPVTEAVVVNNTASDTLSIGSGGFAISGGVSSFGNAVNDAGSNTLSYKTEKDVSGAKRNILVGFTLNTNNVFPAGLTINVTALTSKGTAKVGGVNFTNAIGALDASSLISDISEFITDGSATVTYGVTATQAFTSFGGTLTYTIGTGF